MTSSASPRASLWGRLCWKAAWTLQLAIFLAAGVLVAPIVRPVQNATGPVVSTAHHGERIVSSRSPSREHLGRLRSDARGDSGHEPVWFSPPALPFVAPADFVVVSPWSVASVGPRRVRFALHAPRGPPQQS